VVSLWLQEAVENISMLVRSTIWCEVVLQTLCITLPSSVLICESPQVLSKVQAIRNATWCVAMWETYLVLRSGAVPACSIRMSASPLSSLLRQIRARPGCVSVCVCLRTWMCVCVCVSVCTTAR
jgi:hypothetical protein